MPTVNETASLSLKTASQQMAATSAGPLHGGDLYHSSILVIDDEPSVTSMIKKSLTDSGFKQIICINESIQAIEFVQQNRIDIVLLDIRIPEMDGISILRFLRANQATQFTPVIILTTASDDETRLNALVAGANDYLCKPVIESELVARVKNSLQFKNHADRIQKQIEIVTQELEFDALTGLRNRRAFDHCFENIAEPVAEHTTLILFDIDKFKKTNDTFGHQAGDMVLKTVGQIVADCCGESDFAARIGGDEFAVVCRAMDEAHPQILAEKIRHRIASEPLEIQNQLIESTVSIGIAMISDDVDEKGKLFNAADAALYQSKRQGRNTINIYSNAGVASIGHAHLKNAVRKDDVDEFLSNPKLGRILLVDDEPTVTQMLTAQLNRCDYPNVESENAAENAMAKIKQYRPDLVILDVRMPKINGLEILRMMREKPETKDIPVLVMTSSTDDRVRMAALKLRANDFLTKPITPAELEARVCNSLHLKLQHDHVKKISKQLAHEVEIRTNELFATRRETILCLARAAESRDAETGNHVIRVGHYAAIVARQLGMDEDYVGWIELAAQLHDVGKLSIPDSILLKPAKLTPDERKIIETHCDQADRIFFGRSSRVERAVITSPLLKMAARIASTHHEKWDGSGYPTGLAGEEIPIEGRITAIADVFDALSTKRHYKDAFSLDRCLGIIEEGRGVHFDPKVVDAFVDSIDKVVAAMEKWQDLLPV